MKSGELLRIEPLELKFLFELKKKVQCSLRLSNKTSNHVAFKVKTTNMKMYCVRPNTGIILPWSTCDIIVTMQAQRETPSNMKCKDKFLIQSIVTSPNTVTQDLNREMFNMKLGHVVEEYKLKVIYDSPPSPLLTGEEHSKEDSSLKDSMPSGENVQSSEYALGPSCLVNSRSLLSTLFTQSEALISKLKELKINVFKHNGQLGKKQGFVKLEKANQNKTKIQIDFETPLLQEYNYKPISQEITAIEHALKNASTKIQELEAALEDTTLVLKGIGRRIEELNT